MGDWLFGCDMCQDVCPWNRKPSPGPIAFPHDPALEWLDPVELLGMDADAFRRRFKPTSLWRTRRPGLLRNAAIVLGNTGDERAPAGAGEGVDRLRGSGPRSGGLGDRADSSADFEL